MVKKHLGQHFLINDNVIYEALKYIEQIEEKYILEVGPGRGSITEKIMQMSPKHLYAVEIDKSLERYLKKFQSNKNFSLIFEDSLQFNEEKIIGNKFSVIANLPYNISSQLILKWILKTNNKVEEMIVMLQKELADRILASHGSKKYGTISVIADLFCHREAIMDVGPENFLPKPKVNSSLIKLTFREKPLFEVNTEDFLQMVKAMFTNRRKILLNKIKFIFEITEDYKVQEIMSQLEIKKNSRVESLTTKQFCEMSKIFGKYNDCKAKN